MTNMTPAPRRAWMHVLFYALLFLLFFQLVSEFIESIYTFGLLGVEIPPEIGMVVLFFTPLLLLALPGGLPGRAALALAALAGVLRAVATGLSPQPALIARGLGTGLLFLALPGLWSNLRRWGAPKLAGARMASGLLAALSASILLRASGAGSDFSLLQPWLAALLAVALAAAAWWIESTRPDATPAVQAPARASAPLWALCAGWVATLAVLYFGFTSPTVLARWAEADLRLVTAVLAVALGGYGWLLATGRLARIRAGQLVRWNWLFLTLGVLAIQISAPIFPRSAEAYPFQQAAGSIWQQIPLYLMLLVSPVLLANLQWISGALARMEARPRAFAGGFSLAALLFLIFVFAQVFTTVYDYIPVVGPPMRDRFWLAFLLPGAFSLLPLLLAREAPRDRAMQANSAPAGVGRGIFAMTAALLAAALVATLLLERAPAAAPAARDGLRVVTYNLQQGYDESGNRAYQTQARALVELDADVIGLQETDTARIAGGNADLVRTIQRATGMYAYYGPRTVAGTFGIALLSRYPLQNPRTFYLYSEGEQTAAILAEIQAGATTYTILVTHLGNGGPLVQQQGVLKLLQGRQNVIAMGDFNFRPDTEQYAVTTAQLADAFLLSGGKPTPGLDPARRIDHMFVSPGLAVRSARYIDSPITDHPGLVAEFGR